MRKSKKAKAFELFNQGFTPSSPEVKAVGLHSSNRYKYFYAWEKLGKPAGTSSQTQTAAVSSTTPHGETIGGIDETKGKPKGQSPIISSSKPSGEIIGGIDETKTKPRVQRPKVKPEETLAPEEQILLPGVGEEPEEEEQEPEQLWPEDIPLEKTKASVESIGGFSEVATPKGKDGKPIGPEQKIATTVAEDGIKCTVLLSLQTLTLYSIAKSTQAQFAEIGDGELSMGDFLDTCAEDFFKARGKKLGLINSGPDDCWASSPGKCLRSKTT